MTEREPGMSVWQSPSGRLHWLRRCSASGGALRTRRVTVSRNEVAAAREAGMICRCFRKVEFTPGRRARD